MIFFESNVANIITAVDNNTATIAVVVIIIIIYTVFTNFFIGSHGYFLVLDKCYFIFLISTLRCIRIVRLRPQSVNIMLQLQIRSGDLMRSVMLCVVVDI
jgi:hypothetical protein